MAGMAKKELQKPLFSLRSHLKRKISEIDLRLNNSIVFSIAIF